MPPASRRSLPREAVVQRLNIVHHCARWCANVIASTAVVGGSSICMAQHQSLTAAIATGPGETVCAEEERLHTLLARELERQHALTRRPVPRRSGRPGQCSVARDAARGHQCRKCPPLARSAASGSPVEPGRPIVD